MHSLSPQTGRWSRLRPFRRSSSEGKRLCSPPRCSRSLLRSKRTVGIAANFLCDNSGYIWAQTIRATLQRSLACFAACKGASYLCFGGCRFPLRSGPAGLLPHLDPGVYTGASRSGRVIGRTYCPGANLLFRYQWKLYPRRSRDSACLGAPLSRRYRQPKRYLPRHRRGRAGGVRSPGHQECVRRPIQRRSSGLFQRTGVLFLRQGAEPQRPYRQIRRLRLHGRP